MSKKSDKRPFHLQQFSLFHHRSSMKVGTDSLLLGIWTPINESERILDVGTGCGILALLMAARSNALIHAVELDEASWAEAQDNFTNANFSKRLSAIHNDFNHYADNTRQKYDLIVSNPPYFINDLRSAEMTRSNARHGDSLNFVQLCNGVANLLKKNGRFCLVLPYDESKSFIAIAKNNGLHLNRKLIIFPKRGLQPNRINLELSFKHSSEVISDIFVIREETNQFSKQYIRFFRDYLIGLDS